jgi:dihydrofolate synthase/folylpolyglutamate synthase
MTAFQQAPGGSSESGDAQTASLPDPDEILEPLEGWGVRLELNRVERLLEHLGSPQESYATVLIAGTNGKGSTAALLASMIVSAGYRTGLFTSPHLEGVEERMRVDGRAVGRRELAELLREILDRADAGGLEPPTYFEALTVAACTWFARSNVEIAVVEVGMGGRLDATNTCSPVLSLVSEIGLDHVKPLGDTLGLIAREKAGIFRSGSVAISAASESEAREALREHALEIGAEFQEVDDLVERASVEDCGTSQLVRVKTTTHGYDLELGLVGAHQVRNLLLALAAAEQLALVGWPALDRRAIELGVRNCLWPGRLERLELPNGKIVWLDVAHNPQGAESLASFLAGHLPHYDLLLGSLEDKDARRVFAAVAPRAERIVLTRPPSGRALDPQLLAGWLSSRQSVVEPDPEAALETAIGGDRPLVVCGSLYLVGWVRQALRRRFGVPVPAADLVARTGEPVGES